MEADEKAKKESAAIKDGTAANTLEPLDSYEILAEASADKKNEWTKTALGAMAKGEVAAICLAGGQGTRLGFDGPKGMYNIGLPSGRTLFQMFCERILKLQKIA